MLVDLPLRVVEVTNSSRNIPPVATPSGRRLQSWGTAARWTVTV